jgi:hypothetical protein
MESELVYSDVTLVTFIVGKYVSGDTVAVKYRHGATAVACSSASWNVYSVPFTSAGFVQARIESTL